MALIPCPECKRKVSDRAANCPHCGCPLSDSPKQVRTSEDSFLTRGRGCGDIVIYGPLVFIILIIVLLRSC